MRPLRAFARTARFVLTLEPAAEEARWLLTQAETQPTEVARSRMYAKRFVANSLIPVAMLASYGWALNIGTELLARNNPRPLEILLGATPLWIYGIRRAGVRWGMSFDAGVSFLLEQNFDTKAGATRALLQRTARKGTPMLMHWH